VDSPTQPIVAIAYKRPTQYSKEDPVFDVISLILSSGRTGLLYKELVRRRNRAGGPGSATYPDGRYPNLFGSSPGALGRPQRGRGPEALDDLSAASRRGRWTRKRWHASKPKRAPG